MADRSCPTADPRPRPPGPRRAGCRGVAAATAVAMLCTAVPARGDAGLPPEIVSGFTRSVQPLLINKCGQGACHGGTASTSFQLRRLPGGRSPDRTTTLENLHAFLGMVGPSRDPTPLVHSLAVRHPAAGGRQALVATPLSARERATLEDWLVAVRAAESPRSRFVADAAVIPAVATAPVPSSGAGPPNRFRSLLDAAATPPEFPPPQEPAGVIRLDDLTAGSVPPPPPPPAPDGS